MPVDATVSNDIAAGEGNKENAAPTNALTDATPNDDGDGESIKKKPDDGNEGSAGEGTKNASPAVVGVSKNRTKDANVTNAKRFSDFDEFGFYQGGTIEVDGKPQRHGEGSMIYDSGNTYSGPFLNDKFHGTGGIYKWFDGDEQEGEWQEGERHGRSVFRAADGTVEYSTYVKGEAKGEGVTWSADRTKASKMVDGRKKFEISVEEAEKMAKDVFDLPVPEPSKVVISSSSPSDLDAETVPTAATTASKHLGIFERLFSTKKVGPDGTLFFKDYGEWGTYDGDVNPLGDRQGRGKMTYDNSSYYDGGFVNNKFHGDDGIYHWADGDEYSGQWADGERHGIGTFKTADGTVEIAKYEKGEPKGEKVSWSADRKTAYKVKSGEEAKMEISLGIAKKMAKDMFNLPVPEKSTVTTVPASKNLGFFGRLFAKRKVGPDGKLLFYELGEWGAYEGDLDEAGDRQGKGKMTYVSGNYYEGEFLNDKFHGPAGTYRWNDGEEYVGSWAEGERHGIGLFRKSDGGVEYSMWEKGAPNGEGVEWSGDRKSAHKTLDGKRTNEVSLGIAEKFSRDKFDLPVPAPSDVLSTAPVKSRTGLFGSFFSNRRVGPDGKKQFKDYGDWGSYEGDVDKDGDRQGKGKMTYGSGNYYEGGFIGDKFHGDDGTYRWSDGDEYFGQWKDGERHGKGSFTKADGSVEYCMWEKGAPKGEGVEWSGDRKSAHKTLDGKRTNEVSLGIAEKFSRDKFDLPVPAPSDVLSTAPVKSRTGLFGSFFSNRRVGPDGKKQFKDYGDWGSYEGDVDKDGNRQGKGKMTYDSGNYYEGGFIGDKFHGDDGTYRWSDGDEYFGQWKDGERHGKGSFTKADGSVEYCMWEKGFAKGEGVWWSGDRKSAYNMVDGNKKYEILPEEAEDLAKVKFDLPTPEPSKVVWSAVALPTKNIGFFGRMFPTRKVGPDGKTMLKDNGEWGFYEGDVDPAGNRHGQGKMTYESGNYYEGCFANDKFHGEKGIYHWQDGDEYEGSWKDGERHGIGIFRTADGTVDYSQYEKGHHVKDGVAWSADRKTAHKTVWGKNKIEISLGVAEKIAKDKFDLPVPEPSKATSVTTTAAAVPAASSVKTVGFLGRLFPNRKVGPGGKLFFKDYGDWGSYEGDVDADGNRQGRGKMIYGSKNYFEGGFVNNKFEGPNGIYRWWDGDEYEGSWKNGERNGIGVFRLANGTVEYSMYEGGQSKGDGIWWSADRKTAHALVDGEKKMELLIEEAESLAKEKFDLPIPELSKKASSTTSATASGRILQSKYDVAGPTVREGPRFEDFGDMGTYEGELLNGLRQGEGKMWYDSGNSYEGDFSNDKFDGNRGLYRWSDGAKYEGSWKAGSFDGIGIFHSAAGSVDYSIYKDGYARGVGVIWTDGYTRAHHTLDGVKMDKTSLADAEKLARDKFGLPAPSLKPSLGIMSSLGRIFQSRRIGPDGKPWFKDNSEWGSYIGDFDAAEKRHGQGKMVYESGNFYEGGFVDDKYHGDKGIYRWSDGDEYEGSWKDGERHGIGIFRVADGRVNYSLYEKGSCEGVGVAWSADRKTAHKVLNGEEKDEVSLSVAAKLARDKFDLPVPEPSTVSSQTAPVSTSSSKSIGFFERLFSKRRVGPDGKMHFKDYGDWGSYEGDVDEAGNRQGKGKMTYDSGSCYEGGFVNDKFQCDKGTYRWSDGDEYVGQWKDGERNGKGSFTKADGSVEYSMYEQGQAKGEGVWLSADRQIAHNLLDGEKTLEILAEEAESLVKKKFDSSGMLIQTTK